MVDHTTVWRWCQKYGPMIYHRLRGKLKYTTTTWHMDETYVRIAGRWVYLFRAVDSHGDTVDFYLSETRDRGAAKTFLQKALSNPDNRTPRVLCMDRCRIYPAAIRDLRAEGRLPQRCRRRTKRYSNNRIESDHRNVKRRLRAMQGPRTMPTAHRVIQGIEALCSLIEDRLIRSEWFEALSLHRSGLQHFPQIQLVIYRSSSQFRMTLPLLPERMTRNASSKSR